QRTRDKRAISMAAVTFQQAMSIAPTTSTRLPNYCNYLGVTLWEIFAFSGQLGHLDAAIAAYMRALTYPSVDKSLKATCWRNLAICNSERFKRLSQEKDLDAAVEYARSAVQFTAHDSNAKPNALRTFARILQERFVIRHSPADIDAAISAIKEGVELISDDELVEKAHFMNLHGALHSLRFSIFHDLHDLEATILILKDAVTAGPEGSVTQAESSNNMGIALEKRFTVLNHSTDVDTAIDAERRAVALLPKGHALLPEYSARLSLFLKTRFKQSGLAVDINEAITVLYHTINNTPDSHSQKGHLFDCLGTCLVTRFEVFDSIRDVDSAIAAHQKALSLSHTDELDRALVLCNLGNAYMSRLSHFHDTKDLDAAVLAHQEATQLVPDSHPQKAMHLNNLGTALKNRFRYAKLPKDIDDAIDTLQRAVSLALDPASVSRAIRLTNLGNALQWRGELPGHTADLDAAVEAQEQAVALMPDNNDKRKLVMLNDLASTLHARWERVGAAIDLDAAIDAGEQALSRFEDSDGRKPLILHNLGLWLLERSSLTGSGKDVASAVNHFWRAVCVDTGPPTTVFRASRDLARACAVYELPDMAEMYAAAIEQIPRLVWLGSSVHRRLEAISRDAGGTIPEAAANAIHRNQLTPALEWLETGSAIIWSQVMRLRSPMDDLRVVAPELADRLQEVSKKLDLAGITPSDAQTQSSSSSHDYTHHDLARTYDLLLAQVRDLPGFEDFLLPLKMEQLQGAAASGPIVILNVHKLRCDALILLGSGHGLRHVPLPKLSTDVVKALRKQFVRCLQVAAARTRSRGVYHGLEKQSGNKFSRILSILWTHVVHPVLIELEDYLTRDSSDVLTHVTWCAGPLSFLPLHAAGIYYCDDPCQLKVFDVVVSSYTPSISALLEAQQRRDRRGDASRNDPCVLAVSQPSTIGLPPLPCALDEVAVIHDRFPQSSWLNDGDATPDAVLTAMETCSWIHLACHASQDPRDPTQSAFALHGGALTLAEIMTRSFVHTEFAVLSACETAAGDSALPGEAMHLAAGMFMAGFASVVATMWSIADMDAPVVARELYAYLMEDAGGDTGKSVYALHRAVKVLRELVGEEEFIRWVPYIHVG
ncbi:CHAT domain-containing protein, partial [Vararia minispora EC-137]